MTQISLTTPNTLSSRGSATKYNGGVLASGKQVWVYPVNSTTFQLMEVNSARAFNSFNSIVSSINVSALYTSGAPRWNCVVGHDGTYLVLTYICSDKSVRCRIIRYTAGTGQSYVSTDAEQVAWTAVAGIEPDVMDTDVSISGAVLVGFIYTSSATPVGYKTVMRTTAGNWVAAETIGLEPSAYTFRGYCSEISVTWSRGGGSANRRHDILISYGGSTADKGTWHRHASINEADGTNLSWLPATLLPYAKMPYVSGSIPFATRPRTARGIALADGLTTAIAIKSMESNGGAVGGGYELKHSHFVGTIKTTTLGANAAADVVSVNMVQGSGNSAGNLSSGGRQIDYLASSAIGFNMHPDGNPVFNFIDSYGESYYNPPPGGVTYEYSGIQTAIKILNVSGSFTISEQSAGTVEPRYTGRTKNGEQVNDYWANTQSANSNYAVTDQVWSTSERVSGNQKPVLGWANLDNFVFEALTPLYGTVVTTSRPKVKVAIYDQDGERLVPRSWQVVFTVSNDSQATTGVLNWTSPFRTEGAGTDLTWGGSLVPSGVKYINFKLVDPFGNQRVPGISNQFTVSHPSGATSIVPPFSASDPGPAFYSDPSALGYSVHTIGWTFSDAFSEDAQSAYRILVTDPSSATVYDTGKVPSSAPSGQIRIPFANRNQNLTVTVYTWDMYDTSAAPTTNSRGSIIAYAGPNITAVTAAPLTGADVNAANPVITVVHTPGFRTSAALDVTISKGGAALKSVHIDNPANSQAVAFSSFLDNDTNYTVTASVTDSGGLTHTFTSQFHTLWQPPAAPTGVAVSAANYNVPGLTSIDVTWNNAAKDINWTEWTVYRQVNQVNVDTGAVLAYGPLEFLASVQVDAAAMTYRDVTAPSGVQVGYVVRQKVNRQGSLIESVNITPTVVNPASDGYWLIDPTPVDPAYAAFQLYNVTADEYTAKYESELVHLIGRGMHEDRGDYLGVEGTLTAKFRNGGGTTARQKKLRIESIRAEARTLLMRTPFGDMFYVSVGDIGVARIAGTGLNEFVDVTIPYSEVYR